MSRKKRKFHIESVHLIDGNSKSDQVPSENRHRNTNQTDQELKHKSFDLKSKIVKLKNGSKWLKSSQKQAFRGVLCVITVVIYYNSLTAGFVYDDRVAIVENPNIMGSHEFASWFRLFTDDFWGTPMSSPGSHKSYRPLVSLTFKLQAVIEDLLVGDAHRVQQPNAFLYHLVNLLLHLCMVELVFQVTSEHLCPLVQSKWSHPGTETEVERKSQLSPVACAASLMFACHPIHVEAVTSLVGRAELLGSVLSLLSFNSMAEYLSSEASPAILLAKSELFALLACLSKENCGPAVIIINLFFVIWLALKSAKTEARRKLNAFVFMLALLGLFVLARVQLNSSSTKILPSFSHLDNPLAQSERQFCLRNPELVNITSPNQDLKCTDERMLNKISRSMLYTRLYLPVFSLGLLVYPKELSYDWSLRSIGLVNSFKDTRFILTLGIYLALGIFSVKWLQALAFGQIDTPTRNLVKLVRNHLQQWNNGPKLGSIINEESDDSDDTSSVRSADTIKTIDSGFSDMRPETPSELSECQGQKLSRKRMVDAKRRPEHNEPEWDQFQLDPIGWSLVWLIVPYLPASNLLVPVGFLVAERTLYLASFGFCLLVANVFVHLVAVKWDFKCARSARQDKATKWMVLLVPLVIAGSARTVRRNNDWQSETALYSSNLAQSPARSLANLASLKAQVEEPTSVDPERLYRAALELEPESADLHYNLALELSRKRARRMEEPKAADRRVEYHYKLALKLRKNFPLAALNLGAHQYTSLNQLAEAWKTFHNCAFQMNPNEARSSHHHVRVQIECLISGAKLALDQHQTEGQTNAPSKQTTAAVGVEWCHSVLEWMSEARLKVGQLRELSHASLAASRSEENQFGDLNKQLATIHWIQAQCDTKRPVDEFRRALEFAWRSQVPIVATIYTSYVDSLLSSGLGSRSEAVETLRKTLSIEMAKRHWKRFEIAKIHHRLATLLAPIEPGAARVEIDEAIKLEPDNFNFLSLGGQLAHQLGRLSESQRMFERALSVVRSRKQWAGGDQEDRKLATAHTNYGAILEVRGRMAEARTEYMRALDYDPKNLAALRNLKKLLV